MYHYSNFLEVTLLDRLLINYEPKKIKKFLYDIRETKRITDAL